MKTEKTAGLAGGKKSLDIVTTTKVQFFDFYVKVRLYNKKLKVLNRGKSRLRTVRLLN